MPPITISTTASTTLPLSNNTQPKMKPTTAAMYSTIQSSSIAIPFFLFFKMISCIYRSLHHYMISK